VIVTPPRLAIEVVPLPVSDVDSAVRFYVERIGFVVDVDCAPTDRFRRVQLTPPGSDCSIQIGTGLTDAPPGAARNSYLVVDNLEAARARLTGTGVAVSEIRHKSPLVGWDGSFAAGLDRKRSDYASCADFADPDGNTWVLRERGFVKSGST
jgi:catechol 2,3-dioxygenase-like lactoylglutathione lyase family enzyme